MERAAAVYVLNDRLIIASSPKTTAGIRLHVQPVALSQPVARDILASRLTSALQASEIVVPHPNQAEWKGSIDPIVKAAGVGSFKAFMASAQLVDIDQINENVLVTPNRNLGTKDGFEPLAENAEELPNDMQSVADAVFRLSSQPSP